MRDIRLQAELLGLSTNSKQLIAKKASHDVEAEEPQLVINVILDVVAPVRAKKGTDLFRCCRLSRASEPASSTINY